MAEITLPEVNLPDVKLPEGLRDMSRDDIVRAAKDIHLPRNIDLPDIDLSKAGLPKQITDRLPGRRRTNPILPVAIFLGVAAAVGAAWYLITSPVTGPRLRVALSDLRTRVTGERRDLVRYDDERDLTSLLPDGDDRISTDYANGNTMPDLPTQPATAERVGSGA